MGTAELMDEAEAARYLKCSKRWLAEQRKSGLVKCAKLNVPRYRPAWLDEFKARIDAQRATQNVCLYRYFDANDALLYVGISLGAAVRLAQHRDTSGWFRQVATVTLDWCDSRAVALAAELEAIRTEKPQYNIQWVRRDQR